MSRTSQLVNALAQANREKKLVKHVKAVKDIAQHPQPDREALRKALRQLETRMHNVLAEKSPQTAHLEDELHELRLKLSLSDSKHIKKRLDRILFLLGEIGARADAQTHSKELHEQRVAQLDKKIQAFQRCEVAQPKEEFTTKPIPSPRLFFPDAPKHRLLFSQTIEPRFEPFEARMPSAEHSFAHHEATLPNIISVRRRMESIQLPQQVKQQETPDQLKPAPEPIPAKNDWPAVITVKRRVPEAEKPVVKPVKEPKKPLEHLVTNRPVEFQSDLQEASVPVEQPASETTRGPAVITVRCVEVPSDKQSPKPVPKRLKIHAPEPAKCNIEPAHKTITNDWPDIITVRRVALAPSVVKVDNDAVPDVRLYKVDPVLEVNHEQETPQDFWEKQTQSLEPQVDNIDSDVLKLPSELKLLKRVRPAIVKKLKREAHKALQRDEEFQKMLKPHIPPQDDQVLTYRGKSAFLPHLKLHTRARPAIVKKLRSEAHKALLRDEKLKEIFERKPSVVKPAAKHKAHVPPMLKLIIEAESLIAEKLKLGAHVLHRDEKKLKNIIEEKHGAHKALETESSIVKKLQARRKVHHAPRISFGLPSIRGRKRAHSLKLWSPDKKRVKKQFVLFKRRKKTLPKETKKNSLADVPTPHSMEGMDIDAELAEMEALIEGEHKKD